MRTNEKLWQSIVDKVTKEETHGTKAGQWSARKAQEAVRRYKAEGGGYTTAKSAANSLAKWSRQDWRTKSGKPSSETGERYLPAAAIQALSPEQYAKTSRAKKKGMKEGKQFVPNPPDIAKIVRKFTE
jgi:hypothetical protein